MLKYIILVYFCFLSLVVFGQKEKIVSLNSVRGEYSIVLELSDITGREAMQLARENAKKNALEKVCGSKINIWDQMEVSSAGDVFNSLSINQIDGEIIEFDVIEEGHVKSDIRESETIFYCIANVKVKRGIPADPGFYVNIDGVKSIYFDGDILSYRVSSSKDCYLNLFLFEDETTGYLLYPNEIDINNFIKGNSIYNSEENQTSEIVFVKNAKLLKEVNRIVFLFTKSEMPFSNKILSRAEIEKWIAKIPNDQKYLHFSVIEIRKD